MPLNSILASLFSTGICFAFSFSYFDALTLKKISDVLSSYGPLCHYDFLFYKWGQFIFTDLTLPEFLCPTGTQNLSHLPQQFPAAFGGHISHLPSFCFRLCFLRKSIFNAPSHVIFANLHKSYSVHSFLVKASEATCLGHMSTFSCVLSCYLVFNA